MNRNKFSSWLTQIHNYIIIRTHNEGQLSLASWKKCSNVDDTQILTWIRHGWLCFSSLGEIKYCWEPKVDPVQKNVRWTANLDRFSRSMEAWHSFYVHYNQTSGVFQALVFPPSNTDPSLAEDNWTLAFNAGHLVQTDSLEMVLMSTLL